MTSIPQPTLIPFSPFSGGLDELSDKTFLPSGKVPFARNVWFERGIVRQRKGYARRRRAFSVSSVIYDHSEMTLYKDVTNVFKGLKVGDIVVVVSGTNMTADSYSITAISTDYKTLTFGEVLGTDDSTNAVITSTSLASSVELPVATPPIRGMARMWNVDGNEVEILFTDTKGYTYSFATGSYTNIISTDIACFITNGNISWSPASTDDGTPAIVFTNGLAGIGGASALYYFDGKTPQSLADSRIDMTELGTFAYAKQVAYYANHLMIGDYAITGTRRRNGVAWGELNCLETAFASGAFDGDGAEYLISDAKGYLQRFIPLGAHLAMYFSHSIVICDPVPTDEIYSFDVRVQGTGLIGPNAVVDIGGVHIFVGQDNIYLYDGGLYPQPIGNDIVVNLFSKINPNDLKNIVAQHLPQRDIVIFHLSSSYYAYNYQSGVWTSGEFAHKVVATGFGTQQQAFKCSDLPFKFSPCLMTSNLKLSPYWNTPCSAFSMRLGFEVPIFGTPEGDVFDYSEIDLTDAGAAIPGEFWTDAKPMGDPYGAEGLVSEVRVESKGSPFDLFYSTDFGASWTQVAASVGGFTSMTAQRFPVQIVCQFLMYRVRFDSKTSTAEVRVVSVVDRPYGVRALR